MVSVMFVSIRFVHGQRNNEPFANSQYIYSSTDSDGVDYQVHLPYSTILLGVAFVPLLLALLVLVANVAAYGYWGQTYDSLFLSAVSLMFVGLTALSLFILYSLPQFRISVV